MTNDSLVDKVKNQLHQWDLELTQLDTEAQKEIEQAGRSIKAKYDYKVNQLRQKVDMARKKLDEIV